MRKRQNPNGQSTLPEIDPAYQRQAAYQDALPADPGAALGGAEYAIEPVRPPAPKTWTPAPAPTVDPAAALRHADHLVAMPTNGEIDAGALRAMETVSERSTPTARAFAFAIVGLIFLVVVAIVSAAMYAAGAPASVAWVLFGLGALIAVGLVYIDAQRYSPTGVERHKAGLYKALRTEEINSQERVALRKLEIYEKVLGAIYGNDKQ
jgi:hypothetical protein